MVTKLIININVRVEFMNLMQKPIFLTALFLSCSIASFALAMEKNYIGLSNLEKEHIRLSDSDILLLKQEHQREAKIPYYELPDPWQRSTEHCLSRQDPCKGDWTKLTASYIY